ncbi:DUF6083 domain-containing protein [Streptomyces tropicalis]|uniref:DUF6083 domain-containing protein n=1 Tax=Streptomyces tropicalis TaxID=3034234 RepID=A0ABT6A2L9_9ACTN|nr:DUF6083 domain-containing protein [Streptomyces tropicalis]MDF3298885.1 DUF6083 domain-containing protein [Streptomyces tropicalis]
MGDYHHDDSVIPSIGPDGSRQRPADAPRPWERADRAQAARDGAAGPEPPRPPVCPQCGLTGDRAPTYTGQHVLLEPRLTVPAHLLPGGHRWHVDGNGTAWNGGLDEPPAGTTCRVPHQLACPGLTLDEIQPWRWLTTVRDHNARLAQQRADDAACQETLPDVG